jgi:hypothetical protein
VPNDFGNIEITPVTTPPMLDSSEDYDKYGIKWQHTKRFAEDTKHRKGLIRWVKIVVSIWLGLVLFVVTFNDLLHFRLHDGVLIALLTTTTINILGLAYIVLQGLFDIKLAKGNPELLK